MDHSAFLELCSEFELLVASLRRRGFDRDQAKDAVAEAMVCAYRTSPRIDRSLRSWVCTVAYRIACRQARRAREEPRRAIDGGWAIANHYDVDAFELSEEHTRLLRLLQLLPRQQRRVMERHLDGFNGREISDDLDMLPATVRANLRHAREALKRHVIADEHILRSRAGEKVWEAFQNGDPLPVTPRKVVFEGWVVADRLGVPPGRGKEVEPLDRDEVQHRRHVFPLNDFSWVLDALAKLATEQMVIVADPDGVVLYRRGVRRIMKLADELQFVIGAHWDIGHAGANGIALALIKKRMIMISRWEHYVQAQHGLSCVAVPVFNPLDGRVLCVLNLTAQAIIPPSIRREMDNIVIRLHRQLRTLWTPYS